MISLRRLHIGIGAAGLILSGAVWVSQGAAESFILKTGQVVEGQIIQATRNTVTIRAGGAVRPTSLNLIDQVVVKLADGSELSGEFVSWKDGVIELRSADVLMKVENGKILDDDSAVASSAAQAEPTAEAEVQIDQPPMVETEPGSILAIEGIPEFTLVDGRVLVGQIIHGTGSIITIRLRDGGVVPTSRAQIDRVKFVAENGNAFDGDFIAWSDDVLKLRLDDGVLFASPSKRAVDAGVPVALQGQPESVETAEAVIESADAAISPDTEAAVSVEEVPEEPVTLPAPAVAVPGEGSTSLTAADAAGAGGPVEETVVASANRGVALPTSARNGGDQAKIDGPHMVQSSVFDVVEDSGAVVFEFRLDHPTDRPLVILYAATDDTAKAGEDFEAKSGVVTFDVGSSYAEVRVPLIDDQESEDSEQFHLFLSGDPETVQFSQRQIPATINDND